MNLGELLLRAGAITDVQVQMAMAEQQHLGIKLDRALVRLGAITDELIAMVAARQLGLPRVELNDVAAIPPSLAGLIDEPTCLRLRAVPLHVAAERRAAQVAMSDPLDTAAADEMRRLLGMGIEIFVVPDEAISRSVARLFGRAPAMPTVPAPSRYEADDGPFISNSGKSMRSPASPPAYGVGATMPANGYSGAYRPAPAVAWGDASGRYAVAPMYADQSSRYAVAPGPPGLAMGMQQRIDEHVRLLRAVGTLLYERGVIRPGDAVPPLMR